MLVIDLKKDFSIYIAKKLKSMNGDYNPSLTFEKNVLNYLTLKRRFIVKKKRTVREAKELNIPHEHLNDYIRLKKLLERGKNVNAYLSRDITKGKKDNNAMYKSDSALNRWGTTHFHFNKKGTEYILLATVTENEVYFIKVSKHSENPFTDEALLQILNNNWPELLDKYILNGVGGETLNPEQENNLAKKNINVIRNVNGKTICPPGGGVVGSGHNVFDVMELNKCIKEIRYIEEQVKFNEIAIFESLGVSLDEEVHIQAIFGNNKITFYCKRLHCELNLVGLFDK
jgi:hypothetical protein